ncbi:AMP-dependent synthetase/ligase [Nesterenkonia sp. HG001]|uniref:AMP-dependent synthetase/ligase n=1 Tax=Nesterenkonia sp. HG001 TaxID=2983207 RepID=UPI002AC37E4E|nr:AMP-dependent synthetase/ligase [Nesterenkonia sp. HG001]MDZ5078679.1 AMP-dependent synthetase/ligase [Nesterenkonia sp. HG001]
MTSTEPLTEATTEQVIRLGPSTNVTDGVLALEEASPEQPVYAVPNGSGGWVDVSIRSFVEQVRAVAKGLLGLGIEPGQRVAVMSPTCYSWAVVDQAIWFAGGISVPIYETSSPRQVGDLLADSGAVLVLTGGDEIAATVRTAVEQVGGETAQIPVRGMRTHQELEAIAASGVGVEAAALERARTAAGLDDVATLVYTSGTTGRPKGVRITHRNLAEGAANLMPFVREIVGEGPSRTLLFLPLAHVLARAVQLICLHRGVQVAHSPSTATLAQDLASFRPRWLLGVPRVFEKVYHGAAAAAEAAGKGRIFEAARRTAVEYSRALDDAAAGRGPGPSVGLKARRALFSRLVYAKLHARLGGSAEYMISGASPLNPEIAHFFTGIGVPVKEGYGLTETTAPITLNIPGATRIGSVGLPVPGTTVRIAEDGEVLLAGPVVFDGYDHHEDATAEAFVDGFFRTGDLGALDADGFLSITGRKKELLVTAGGKNVHPAPLEETVRAHRLVAQAVVVGDDRPFVSALVTLDAEALPAWCAEQGAGELSLEQACTDDRVRAAVQTAVDEANATVSRAESIRRVRILDVELTEESGHLTPSMKLQRHKVIADFAEDVEALYAR